MKAKRVIALILIVSATVVNLYGWQTSKAPSIRILRIESTAFEYWHLMGLPSANVTLSVVYSADGALSVNNPIHVRAVILDSNLTVAGFVQYYPYLGYTDAFNARTPPDKSDIPSFSKLTWEPNASGTYIGEGDLIWLYEGPSWSYFMPHGNVGVRYPDVEKGMPSLTISPLADTFSVQNNEISQRLTWIAAGFSILLLQPIFEALFLKDGPQEVVIMSGKLPRQGLWSQDRKDPKQTTDASNLNTSDSHDKTGA